MDYSDITTITTDMDNDKSKNQRNLLTNLPYSSKYSKELKKIEQYKKVDKIGNIHYLIPFNKIYLTKNPAYNSLKFTIEILNKNSWRKLLQLEKQDSNITGVKIKAYHSSRGTIVNDFQITNEEIKKLNKIINLTKLSARRNAYSITNKGLECLKNIKYLDLEFNESITDEGVKHLKKIEFLNIRNSKKISIDFFMQLKNIKGIAINYTIINEIKNKKLFLQFLENNKNLNYLYRGFFEYKNYEKIKQLRIRLKEKSLSKNKKPFKISKKSLKKLETSRFQSRGGKQSVVYRSRYIYGQSKRNLQPSYIKIN